MIRRRVLPFGAETGPDGVRFRLWAPALQEAAVVLEGDAPRTVAMTRGAEGWFDVTIGEAGPGTRYRYRAGDLLVPDPAARFQPADAHGPSEVIDPAAYQWRDVGWTGIAWPDAVIYELHVGTFSAEGTFAGVERHLDHLVRLGVTLVELMPVADFPGRRNWGYDGVLLFAPDASYGRPEDMKRLVEACHARGLGVLLDVVYNHFGPDANYLHAYAPQFFTDQHATPWGAAINFDGAARAAVRQFYRENALYWLEEFHLDGLRFDAVHAIRDDSEPDIVAEIGAAIRERLGDRPHLVLENDRNEARHLRRDGGRPVLYTAQWDDDWHHAMRVSATAERGGYYADYAAAPGRSLGRALAEGFVFQGEASDYRDGERRGEPSADLPPAAFVSFIQNHDQVGNNAFGTRLSQQAEDAAIHAATAVLLLSPQVPMLFMGQEWGTERPFCFFCDFAGDLAEAVREGRRREFAKFPEFQDEAARERIPDPTAEATFAASKLDWESVGDGRHAAQLERHRVLIAVRRRVIAPRLAGMGGNAGTFEVLGERAVRVGWRLGDGARLTLVANFGADAAVDAGMPDDDLNAPLYATAPLEGGTVPPRAAVFWLERAPR